MKKKNISYGKQTIDRKDIKAVSKILQSDFLTQGPTIAMFEKKLANYCQVKFGVAYSSGTAALHAACFAAGIEIGDEVITSPLTFAASANCILYMGGTPIFADTMIDVPLIDVDEIKKKITPNTKAIIPVDYSGLPADYEEINKIAKKHHLIVIADAAHSLGATYHNKRVGGLTDMTVFPFHPVKSITTGEGGMVMTNNKKFYERLLLFRTHGITKNFKQLRNKNYGSWYYEMQELGFNYRLTDIQAALGISQLKKLSKFIARRKQIAKKYLDSFTSNNNFLCMPQYSDRTSAWHLFPIQLSSKLGLKRDTVFSKFHKEGISVQVHYIPVHLHPYYRKMFGYKKGDFPYVEKYFEREISLPIFPQLSTSDLSRIIRTVHEVIN